MEKLAYTQDEYIAYLNMSRTMHLLVEGSDDRRAFELLFDEYFIKNPIQQFDIDIDTGEILIGFSPTIGNREKVESVCSAMAGRPESERLVGFVDREFREFSISNQLIDLLTGHKIADRLVWSRGHSIENYYFEYTCIRRALRAFSVCDNITEALALLNTIFDSLLSIICAITITGKQTSSLRVLQNAAHWKIFNISTGHIELNLNEWEMRLRRINGISDDQIRDIIDYFRTSINITISANPDVVRWLCHGHIGMSYIWAAYARCVNEVTNDIKQAQRVLKAEEAVRFNATVDSWVYDVLNGRAIYPAEVFELLGFSLL